MIESLFGLGIRRLVSEIDGGIQLDLKVVEDLLLEIVRPEVLLAQVILHEDDGVFRLPVLHLLRLAILGGIDLRMAVPAIGLALDERGTAAATGAIYGLSGDAIDSDDVIAIDGDAGESVSLSFDAEVLDLGLHFDIH